MPLMVDNNIQGELDLDQINALINDYKEDDSHFVNIKGICLESSQNYLGGKVLSLEYL
jgi:threonine aldolase